MIFSTLPKGTSSYLNLNNNNQQIASLSCGEKAVPGNAILNGIDHSQPTVCRLTVSGATTPYYPYNGLLADTNGNDTVAKLALVEEWSRNALVLSSHAATTTTAARRSLRVFPDRPPLGARDRARFNHQLQRGRADSRRRDLGGIGNVGLGGGKAYPAVDPVRGHLGDRIAERGIYPPPPASCMSTAI